MRPLTIFLTQHTPLIHFQHDQAGATLRATEVKAKLDKYLMQNLFHGDIEKSRKFIVGGKRGEHPALNYKLSISINGKKKLNHLISSNDKFPMFFANMGSDYSQSPRKLIWYSQLTLKVQSFHSSLLKQIDKQVGAFFAKTNFGMRSTKGYGSFTRLNDPVAPDGAFQFFVRSKNWKTVLSVVDLFYKSIRSGMNGAIDPFSGSYIRGFYMKPMIFCYAWDNEIKWEKKVIKESNPTFRNKLQSQQLNHEDKVNTPDEWPLWVDYREGRIVRDLLGLSTDQKWMNYPGGRQGASITKEHVEESIDRFPSPIIFKPIMVNEGYNIYFWTRQIPQEYLQASFDVKINEQSIGQIPIWQEFNLDSFLKQYLTVEKLERAMRYDDYNPKQSKIADLLFDIYEQIENNRQIG